MKFALVEGNKTEATKGARGTCPSCDSELIAKCGEVKINHWAHKGNRNCDQWWENETEWHRSWKGHFPIEWQEVVQFDKNGEKHIVDVKTEEGWVLEFQHSYIKPEERRSRNSFYQNIIWIVDGTRRKRDLSQFYKKVLEEASVIKIGELKLIHVDFPEESRILKEWLDCGVPVFIDFQDSEELWFLLPVKSNYTAYILPFYRSYFIELHNSNGFEKIRNSIFLTIQNYFNYIKKKKQLETNMIMNYRWRKIHPRKRYRRRF